MRIGIYVDVARGEQPTGIGRHVLCLLDALAAIDDRNEYLLYYPARTLGRCEKFLHSPKQSNFRTRPVRFPTGWDTEHPRLWWKWYLPRVLRRDRVDIFHGPNHFVPCFDRRKTVLTIHDLAYFKMTVHGNGLDKIFQYWTRLSLDWAGRVIALSENTKRDVEELGADPERIEVIYGGGNIVPDERIAYKRTDELRQALKLPEKFILFIGTLQPRKNVPFLVRAFAHMKSENVSMPHKLVLAGPKGDASGEIEALAGELGIADDLIITGYLDDWQIPLLYKNSDACVLPSKYEGFGQVVLESMAYGTPVIASRSSSLVEIVHDAGMLIDLDDIEQLSDAMTSMLTDINLREDLIDRGRERAQKFTWEQCAKQTRRLYEDMHRSNTIKGSGA